MSTLTTPHADLAGRRAVVTGASSGIGRAVVRQMVAAGADVLAVGRDKERLAETCHDQVGAVPFPSDLTEPDAAEEIIGAAVRAFGGLDIVVNNAGDFRPTPLSSLEREDCDHLMEINVVVPALLTQAALPHLQGGPGGCVVNVSSTYGQKAVAGASIYGASKAALEHLTRCWALEVAPQGVRVNAVAPGPTETPLLSRLMPPDLAEKVKERERRSIPLGRRGEPDDVATWVVALCGPDAAWITGQVLGVDGGLGMGG